jgi:signal transduction histidine kinase
MTNREILLPFCPSDCRISPGRDADCDGATDTDDKSQIRHLLRTIDFYATVLAIACHDLRQPLQAIVGAHELLARRLTARSERQHLKRSEQTSAQLEEKLDQLVDALQLEQRARRIEPEPIRLEHVLQRLALQLDGPARRRGSIFASCRPVL